MLRRSELANFNHRTVIKVTANYTVTLLDEIILVDATAGNVTITLPNVAGNKNLSLVVKKTDSSANTVIIQGSTSSEKIDDATTQTIASQYDVIGVVSDGSSWQTTSIPTTSGGGAISGATTITSSSANALVVGANGNTNPAFKVDASAGSAATGLKIAATAVGTNIVLSVISSGTNEGLTIKSKGTSAIVVAPGSDTANAFQVQNAAGSNVAFNVDTSAGSNATGITIQAKPAGSGIVLVVTSSGTNEDFAFNTKGTGKFRFSPGANSTTAFQATKADGSTVVVNVDSTNARVGINTATPLQALHVAGGGLLISGNTSGVNGTFVMLDQFSGSARMYIQGQDASTNGDFSLTVQRSDQSNALAAFKVSAAGVVGLSTATAPAAGGSAAAFVQIGTVAGFGIYHGTGAPSVTAAQGSIYMRRDGGASTEMYVNRDGGTTWKAVTTAA